MLARIVIIEEKSNKIAKIYYEEYKVYKTIGRYVIPILPSMLFYNFDIILAVRLSTVMWKSVILEN